MIIVQIFSHHKRNANVNLNGLKVQIGYRKGSCKTIQQNHSICNFDHVETLKYPSNILHFSRVGNTDCLSLFCVTVAPSALLNPKWDDAVE